MQLLTTSHEHFDRQPVAEITEKTVTVQRPTRTDVSSATVPATSHSRVRLENALDSVDSLAESFLDSAQGTAFYFSDPGVDPIERVSALRGE